MMCNIKGCLSIVIVLSLSFSSVGLSAAQDLKKKPTKTTKSIKTTKPVTKLNPKAVKSLQRVEKVKMLSDRTYQNKLKAHKLKAQPIKVKRSFGPHAVAQSQNTDFKGTYDCDDSNNAVRPGAAEVCDGFDNDCDGAVDEDVAASYFLDADGDGWGDSNRTLFACRVEPGYAARGNDCDDRSLQVYPGAAEIPGNDIDENCDGQK